MRAIIRIFMVNWRVSFCSFLILSSYFYQIQYLLVPIWVALLNVSPTTVDTCHLFIKRSQYCMKDSIICEKNYEWANISFVLCLYPKSSTLIIFLNLTSIMMKVISFAAPIISSISIFSFLLGCSSANTSVSTTHFFLENSNCWFCWEESAIDVLWWVLNVIRST